MIKCILKILLAVFLLFVFIFCSCSYRIYVNGKYNHKICTILEKGERVSTLPDDSTIIVVGIDENVPSLAKFINETKILSPNYSFWGAGYLQRTETPYETILGKARDEAKQVGANIIKITKRPEQVFNRNRAEFIAKMYFLNPRLNVFKKLQDALSPNRNLCIVHLRNLISDSCSIYFNDSLIIPVFKNQNITVFSSDSSGVLKCKVIGRKKGLNPIYTILATAYLKKGEEYYLNMTYYRRGGFYLKAFDKDSF
jgi:hypothetical protein